MLTKQNTGIVFVDIQGKLARIVDGSEALINNNQKLLKAAKILNLPVIWLEQNPEKLGSTIDELKDLIADTQPIVKFTFNACLEEAFIKAVEQTGVNNWLVCGIEAHICVYQTSSGLLERGHKVHLLSDCIASREASNRQLAIDKLAARGAEITGLEMCLYELVEDCRADEFKPILQLIK